ncbi:hypothetical protein EHI2019_000852000 [Entamoeba histolytica]
MYNKLHPLDLCRYISILDSGNDIATNSIYYPKLAFEIIKIFNEATISQIATTFGPCIIYNSADFSIQSVIKDLIDIMLEQYDYICDDLNKKESNFLHILVILQLYQMKISL